MPTRSRCGQRRAPPDPQPCRLDSRPARPAAPRPFPPAADLAARSARVEPRRRPSPSPPTPAHAHPPAPWGDPVGYGLVPIPVRLGCLEGGVVCGSALTVVHSRLWMTLGLVHRPLFAVRSVPWLPVCLGLVFLPPSLSLSWVALRPGGSRLTVVARADWAPSPPS